MNRNVRVIREKPPRQAIRQVHKREGMDIGRVHAYRGYILTRQRGGTWQAAFRFAPLFPQLPRAFTWTRINDLPGLRSYIDAWFSGLDARTTALERDGSVTATVYGGETETITTIRVDIAEFVAALKMARSFVIPAWTKIEFVTDGVRRLVPADFVAALKDLAPEAFADYPTSGWRRAVDRDLPDIKTQVQADASETAPADVVAQPAIDMDEPPREQLVDRFTDGDALHLTTHTTKPGLAPYYTKRIVARGRTIYSATAWMLEGPWKVWTRDTSALLARGINL